MAPIESMICEFCGGSGWQVVLENGVSRARRCNCSSLGEEESALDAARIPPRYLECDFDNYNPMTQASMQGKAKKMASDYASQFPSLGDEFGAGGLLFSGAAGTGKTHLAVAVLKSILLKGIPCLFVDFHDLLTEIRHSYDEVSATSELQILRPILTTEVLLLDDLGSQRLTDWMQDTVFHVINLRYQQKKTLIVTTNLAVEPQGKMIQETLRDRLGYRVVSRLYEMCTFIELDGPDYRRDVRKAGSDLLRRRE